MSNFFNYKSPVCTQSNALSVFSFDPSILSLKELLLFEIRETAYYAQKLYELTNNHFAARRKIINQIGFISTNLDFKRNSLCDEIIKTRKYRKTLEKKYVEICKQNNITPVLLDKIQTKNSANDIINLISEGESISITKNKKLSAEKKSIYEIMMNLASNACIYLRELSFVKKSDIGAEMAVLKLLSDSNFLELDNEILIDKIKKFNKDNDKLLQRFRKLVYEEYGPFRQVDVPNLVKKGKALLVSGHYFRDLKLALEATENTDISVYTHGEMIMAHALEGFQKYKNLVGHYQKNSQNFLDDFASFKGAILLSRNPQPCEDLIRGNLFSFSDFPARGVKKITEKNLSPLIEATQNSKGFKSDKIFGSISVGFNEAEVSKKLDIIIQKIKLKNIKSLLLLGLINYLEETDEYIEKLLNIVPKDAFVINIGHGEDSSNVWNINAYSEMIAFYYIIRKLKTEFDISNLNFSVFLTRCDRLTIFHIIHMAELGIKKIFLGECCPSTVSPSLVRGLQDIFNVRLITRNPEADIKSMCSG